MGYFWENLLPNLIWLKMRYTLQMISGENDDWPVDGMGYSIFRQARMEVIGEWNWVVLSGAFNRLISGKIYNFVICSRQKQRFPVIFPIIQFWDFNIYERWCPSFHQAFWPTLTWRVLIPAIYAYSGIWLSTWALCWSACIGGGKPQVLDSFGHRRSIISTISIMNGMSLKFARLSLPWQSSSVYLPA